MSAFKVGDLVTVLPPYDEDPYILSFQHYGRIAEVLPGGRYRVVLGATWPPEETFGPFGADRLQGSWRNPTDGSWWIHT